MDLPAFLALAGRRGGGLIYMSAAPFDPTQPHDVDDPPAHLVQHAGKVGSVDVASMAGGLLHLWQQATPWSQEWQQLNGQGRTRAYLSRGNDDEDEPLSEEAQTQMVTEAVDLLLADPEFQQTKAASARRPITTRFPLSHADGLHAPTHIRDELLARAMHLRKTGTLGVTRANTQDQSEALFTDI
ncbi:hypothetical protein ACIBEJ_51700 [Nonomuraea sp. NPDC050790]|uniref:hypothetical protein n=1 Tax=Nonomuraea sp. NPDC050790 TaxID=3364371 RepID=UPI0037A68591